LRLFAAVSILAVCPAEDTQTQPRWKVQYFYDETKSSLSIADLQFPSARRGVAVGDIDRAGGHTSPVAVVTADGGEHWQVLPLRDAPVSLFFRNDALGWMVTAKGLWQTTEAGRNWTRLPKPPAPIVRVYFVSETHGWAVGLKKSILETHDGGRHWVPLAAAVEPPGKPEFSAYTWIAFANSQYGLINGWNLPPQRDEPEVPAWVDPDEGLRRRELPHLNYAVATNDGGKTWRAGSASVFGEASRIRFNPDGLGMSLVVYGQNFAVPSEVYRLDWHSGKSESVYKNPQFSISDLWLDPGGRLYLAGVVSPGKLRDVVPGKVQVLVSDDYTAWTEMPVDYRAVARRVTLAGAGGSLWLATDTGMILKLEK
jgi:photosystem II stability/assembly factor-like uncharacterized protein